jgi:hypothetical protein
MIISIDVDYSDSSKNILVEVCVANSSVTLDLKQQTKTLLLDFDLLICNQVIDLKFFCNDLCIVNHPVTITNITLDNFYQGPKILYQGCPKFDQQFLSFALQKNMYLDPTVNDSNRLDFTGELTYQFIWPFYKNVFQ